MRKGNIFGASLHNSYGFNSWLYEKDGSISQEWESYGHYILGENEEIIVIENDRTIPTNSKVVRLNLDGTIEQGYKLKYCDSSNPCMLKNNDFVFINGGEIHVVNLALKQESCFMLIDDFMERSEDFSRPKLNYQNNLLEASIYELKDRAKHRYQEHQWSIELIPDFL